MQAILITDKPKWCRLMMNGDKTVEVRKGDKLYKATQKLIDEYGYADIYVYCTKAHDFKDEIYLEDFVDKPINMPLGKTLLNGKIAFKFRCYKVEELSIKYGVGWQTKTIKGKEQVEKLTQLSVFQLFEYCGRKTSTAIHISYLEIFYKPKELSEFYKAGAKEEYEHIMSIDETQAKPYIDEFYKLTKAPQSFCYVETGGYDNGSK